MDSHKHPTETDPKNARKRIKSTPLRVTQKRARYSMKCGPDIPNCSHKKGDYQCGGVTKADADSFAECFYASTSKIVQDCFILKYCFGYAPQRINRRNGGPEKGICIDYSLRKNNGKIIKICKKAFYRVLKISEFRVKRLCKMHLKTGMMPVEKRGGDRKAQKFFNKRAAIVGYIKKFKILEIHYCRSKIKSRQYLSSDLSINKMAKMYNAQAQPDLRVKRTYFRKIFNTKFNIGFKTPGTDMCSTCLMLDEQIKFEKNAKKKVSFFQKKRVHKLRAKAFFKLLNETAPEIMTLSMDCQKNQVLPKVPDQAAYFSRQLYQYNFGIVEGASTSALTKSNVYLYPWTENERPKGSNEIASALFHRLNQSSKEKRNRKKTKIRLMADGCGGQNKNSIVVGMLAYWLLTKSPKNIKEIEFIFPVVGHSYIPPDRVFGHIEKDVKNKQTVIDPKEYTEIFQEHGTTVALGGKECPVYDWKAAAKSFLRTPAQLHFEFNKCKRFVLRKAGENVEIRGEQSYVVNAGEFKTFNKAGKSISKMNPSELKSGEVDKKLKMSDVNKLLKKHFGNNWMKMPKLSFYKNWMESVTGEPLIDLNAEDDESEEEEEMEDCSDDPICECCCENDDDLDDLQESGEVRKKSDWRTLQQHYYPEGGWGWIITFCALSSHALALGVQLYLSTVVFQHFQKGWLGSLSMAVSMFLSPLWVSICKRKSTRLTAVFGGLVAALGCLFTSFATKFHQVFITYGFFIAIGVGMTRDSSSLMVGQYFKRKRELVEIVVVAGSGLGILIMAIAVHLAISSLGWRLVLQAITGTVFLTFFLGTCYRSASLYHPQRRAILHLKNQKRKVWTQPKNMKEKEKREDKPPFLDFSCLRSKTLQILLLSTAFTSFGINTPLFSLVIECNDEVDHFNLVLLHIYVGIAWIVGCFLFGLIVIQKNQECRVSKQYLCQMASLVCGVSIVALTAVEGFGGLVIFVWVYGFSLGGYNYALKVYTYERVRARHFPRAWGFVQCSQGITLASGVALSGYINSTIGYKLGYYLAAVTVFLGSSFLFLTDVRRRRLSRRKTNNSSMKTNETTETVQSPKARKISFSFPVEPVPTQSKHDSEGQIAGIDPSMLAKELTCISEEGLIDMDFQDIYFEEWADYFGDCITSCNKVENCLLSEYDPEYAVLIERRARRWSAARPSFAQAAHAGIGATAAALASGVVGVGTGNANGGNGTANGSTVPANINSSTSSSHHHHHLLPPGSFHFIPAFSPMPHQHSHDGSFSIPTSGTAPLACPDEPSSNNMPTATGGDGSISQLSGSAGIREIPVFRNPPRRGRSSTVEPPSRGITVIDEASV